MKIKYSVTNKSLFLFAFLLLIISSVFLKINNHISYILNLLSLIILLRNTDITKIVKLPKALNVFYIILFTYNLILILRLLDNHEGYSWGSYVFHPYMLQSIFLFFLILSKNNSYVLYLLNKCPYCAIIGICISIIDIELSIQVVNCYIYFYIIYINFFFKKNLKEFIILIFTFSIIYYNVFILGNRLILVYLILMQISIFTIKIFPKIKKFLWYVYILFPFIFVTLLYNYNISLLDTSNFYVKGNRNATEEMLMADTRTFLFYETKKTLEKNNTVMFGNGLNGLITTSLNSDIDLSVNKKGERKFIESNILDLLRRGGVFYFILYSILLIVSSSKLIKSKNKILQTLGFYIATLFSCSILGFNHIYNTETILLMLLISLSNDKLLLAKYSHSPCK